MVDRWDDEIVRREYVEWSFNTRRLRETLDRGDRHELVAYHWLNLEEIDARRLARVRLGGAW